VSAYSEPIPVQDFQRDGYIVLPGWFSHIELKTLRGVCNRLLSEARLKRRCSDPSSISLTIPGSRYFLPNPSEKIQRLRQLVHGPQMQEVCRAILGPEAYLYHDHFVVKLAGGAEFPWHQDSAYDGFDHEPYISCWCALDDMTRINGTLSVVPTALNDLANLSHGHLCTGERSLLSSHQDAVSLLADAGSVVVMSSRLVHSSGANRSDQIRRAYVVFYTPRPMYLPGTRTQVGRAEPMFTHQAMVEHT
jgi:hypothetical protein